MNPMPLAGAGRSSARRTDLQIATIALARELTLVTVNARHVARFPDLRVENWLE